MCGNFSAAILQDVPVIAESAGLCWKSAYRGDTLDFLKLLRVRRSRLLALFLFSLMVSLVVLGQQSANNQQNSNQQNADNQPSPGFTADEIIQLLQGDPQLLADAKTEIVAALRDRGYSVTERDITDDRLFSTIRTDDRARQLLSDALLERGYVPEAAQAQQQQQQQNQPPRTGTNTARQGNAQSPNGQQRTATGAKNEQPNQATNPSEGTDKQRERNKKGRSMQSEYPLRNLPALRDLYTQSPTDDRVLERFGASLFRNSTVATDKPSLDVPVGPDYILGPGDELVVEYWAVPRRERNSRWTAKAVSCCRKPAPSWWRDAVWVMRRI